MYTIFEGYTYPKDISKGVLLDLPVKGKMQIVTVQQARKDISRLLDAVAEGDEITIMRRGKPAAILKAAASTQEKCVKFPDRSSFRQELPRAKIPSTQLVRDMREEKG